MEKLYKNLKKYAVYVVIACFLVTIPILINQFTTASAKIVEHTAKEDAQRIAKALKVMREAYTKGVVATAKKQLHITNDYKNPKYNDTISGKIGAIPLPATLTMEIAEGLSSKGSEINLYSKFPFPWRKDRKISPFQERAWDYFVKNHTGSTSTNMEYYELDEESQIIRYAIPDLMVADACVKCHNTVADTPKNDWKLGDVRGVISVVRPMNSGVAIVEKSNTTFFISLGVMLFLIAIVLVMMISRNRKLLLNIGVISTVINKIKVGNLQYEKLEIKDDVLAPLVIGIEDVTNYLKEASEFADDIGNANFDKDFKEKSEDDVLGNSLVAMKDNLVTVKEEGERRNWATVGLAKFADILRSSNDSMEELSDKIISNLVKYLHANQGSIFVINDDQRNKELILTASYAWERKKYQSKIIQLGEGLVGRCWQEAEAIYMTNIPENYINITSGLGGANPTSILIVPMKIEAEVYGVIELASFYEIKPFEIEFIEKLAESIASTIANTKTNIRTAKLLTESNEMTEQLQAQEEEMRQNMEEMQATQEEMDKGRRELEGQHTALNAAAIVSEADRKGHITYVNDLFCELSGFSREELIGKNHNIVRHPDMPKKAFKDMWATIGKGNVWKGKVKNKKKGGGFYWVDATITPVLGENGKPENI